MRGTTDLTEAEIEQMAGAVICRVNVAFARDPSPTGMAKAVRKFRTGLEKVDRVVECYARYTLALTGE